MTEFKHGEMVCNAGELFYVRVTSEGEKTFQPVTARQPRYQPERATSPVLRAAQGNLFSFSKIPDGTLTMKKGYLVKHGDYAKSLLTGEVLPTDAEWVKPFSKIGKLGKGGKDVKKLNKLPKGAILTDDSCDTWECKAEGLVFGHHLKLAEEPHYSFDKYLIEIPKS